MDFGQPLGPGAHCGLVAGRDCTPVSCYLTRQERCTDFCSYACSGGNLAKTVIKNLGRGFTSLWSHVNVSKRARTGNRAL